MKKFKPHYSGNASRAFWDKINNNYKESPRFHGSLYGAAIILQNVETDVLKWLNNEITMQESERKRRATQRQKEGAK